MATHPTPHAEEHAEHPHHEAGFVEKYLWSTDHKMIAMQYLFTGLAMGMIVFIIASGLTLVFGLMDVLNFGHGVFIALGAFMATTVMGGMAVFADQGALQALLAIFCAMVVAMLVAGALGLAFERVIVRPVYGLHLKQILITMGGMIVGEEIIKVI